MKPKTKKRVIGGTIIAGSILYYLCNRVKIEVFNVNDRSKSLDYKVTIGFKVFKGTISALTKDTFRAVHRGKTLRVLPVNGSILITVNDKNNATIRTKEQHFKTIGIVEDNFEPFILPQSIKSRVSVFN